MKKQGNLKRVLSLVLFAAISALLSPRSQAATFVSTLSGSSGNPQVCSLVFIDACHRAVHQCMSQPDADNFECDHGCEETEVTDHYSVGDNHYCTVTATLNAVENPYRRVDLSPRIGKLRYSTPKECYSHLENIRAINPSNVWFSDTNPVGLQEECNGSTLEVRIIPNVERAREKGGSIFVQASSDFSWESDCRDALQTLLNLQTKDFIVSSNRGCSRTWSSPWYNKQYSFLFDVRFTHLFEDK